MHMTLPKKAARVFLLLMLVWHMNPEWAINAVHAEETRETATSETIDVASSDSQETEGVDGIAVYYAKRYQGKKTNSGAIFDHNKLTAAHPNLPHGTRVRVINIANGKSVVVTINDRCRKRSFEIIDLTRKAAKALGFYGKSSAKVRIIPLLEG